MPYAPGGIADIAARIVGAKLTEAWGQQVAVENRPGGNGFIAMELTAHSAPDGYTLVMCTVGDVAINPGLFKDMPYNVERDFAPIASVSDAPVVLATHGASPYKTVNDVIAAAKAQPGTLNVGTPGYGSINQLILEFDGAQYRHQIRPRAVQGRRAGGAGAGGGRYPACGFGELHGGAACAERQYPGAGGDLDQALAAQSGMADHAGRGRRRHQRVELDVVAWRPRRRRSRSSTSSMPRW